ncbi:MAG: deoxyuridine 5'-triphosphate nucleotidohydrolase [Chloroflexota bacterium]
MTVLPKQTISDLVGGSSRLVSGLISPEDQLQPCGLDLTLATVYELTEAGRLGVHDRHLPDRVPLAFDFWGWLHLAPGHYSVLYNETVCLPLDLMALGRPRSSLQRCGATLHTAVWDPGYTGRSESLLVIHNAGGIDLQKDARILQLVFFRLQQPTSAPYAGHYQRENL